MKQQPYTNRIVDYLNSRRPDIPLVYFCNGGSSYLETQLKIPVASNVHVSNAVYNYNLCLLFITFILRYNL